MKGIVEKTLDADGKPMLSLKQSKFTDADRASFKQWCVPMQFCMCVDGNAGPYLVSNCNIIDGLDMASNCIIIVSGVCRNRYSDDVCTLATKLQFVWVKDKDLHRFDVASNFLPLKDAGTCPGSSRLLVQRLVAGDCKVPSIVCNRWFGVHQIRLFGFFFFCCSEIKTQNETMNGHAPYCPDPCKLARTLK